MSQLTDLVYLMGYIGTRYTFTPEHYPSLEGLSPEHKKAFAVSHSVHHMCKSIGKLATECERCDHGGVMSDAALEEGAVKMFINAVKLVEELGLTAQDLANKIPEYMASK